MTRVNIVIPFFEVSVNTNNSEVIREIVKEKYAISNCEVIWMNSSYGKDVFQCAIKVNNFGLNMDEILSKIQRVQELQQSIARMKVDVFNTIKKHEQLLVDRRVGLNLQKMREMVVNEIEDSEVSLKIEERDRQGAGREKEMGVNEQQFVAAISELTRQNIKLKDALIYYQAQMEAFVRSNQQGVEKREGNK